MAITLTSLPNELLLRIYKNLDHTDLYSQSKTCRTLHFVTLHVLFQRHWNGFPSHKLELDLDGPPSRSLLRALQSALFLYDDIRYVSVIFSTNVYMLYTQILTLTALVQRLKSLENLHLYLGRLQPWYSVQDPWKNPVIGFEQMIVALQGLMDTAFAKGCTDLIVSSGCSLESVRRRGIRGQLAGGIHGVVRQLGDMFTKTETGRPNLIWRGLTSIPGFGSKGGIVSSCRSVCIMADLLIHPASLDWTLRFLNHSHLTTLVIRWSGFSWEALRDILPRIYIPRLESFSFSGWKATPPDLVLFSQAHSRTITSISISIAYASSDGVRWHPGRGAKVYLDLPKLRYIKLSSAYLPWFFGAVWSNPRRAALRTLPNLSHVTIIGRTWHSNELPDLGPVINSIVQLFRSGAGTAPSRPDDWFSDLTFDLTDMNSACFVDWCRLYSESQFSRSNHTSVLSLVKNLNVTNFRIPHRFKNVEDNLFGVLPRFCAIFPNLRVFNLSQIEVESMKRRAVDKRYWQGFHEGCPTLEVVKFNDEVEMKMVDLVKGYTPSF